MSSRRKTKTKSKSRSKSRTATKKVKTTSSYKKLSQIATKPEDNQNCLGVVLDATGAYKTYDSTDYVTKLKIIDPSFNSLSNKTNYKDFVQIFIYTSTAAEAPRVARIGDIIRLKGFDFRTYQNQVVKGVLNKSTSQWAVYDGRTNANNSSISKSKKYTTSLNNTDKNTLKALRKWAHGFFGKNSIKNMNWFQRDINVPSEGNQIIEIKDVDMIAKLLRDAVYIVDDTVYHKLAFVDENGDVFFAEYAGHFEKISKGDVVKLRSISVVITGGEGNDSRKITFNNYSTVLLLNNNTVDFKDLIKATKKVNIKKDELEGQEFQELHLDKMEKTQIGLNTFAFTSDEGDINLGNLQNNMVKGFPLLDRFDHGEDDFLYQNKFGFKFFSKRGSAVLKKYTGEGAKTHTFKELFAIQDEILQNPEAAQKYQHQKFLVRGFILATEFDYIFQTAKLYSPSLNKVWDFDLHEKASKQANDIQVILHNVFYMKDQSIETEQKCFPVYLITFDGNPQYSFDLWKTLPDYLDLSKWFDLPENRILKFTQMMENLKAPQYFYDMVVQLMVNNQGKVYFRMVDTIFWFNNN